MVGDATLNPADVALLAFLQIKGVGAGAARRRIVPDAPEGGDPWALLQTYAPDQPEDVRERALVAAIAICEQCEREGIELRRLGRAGYPAPLEKIPDPPPFVYLRGKAPEDWSPAVAVIGTREPSDHSVRCTWRLVEALSQRRETIVVSGLALGIDTAAHLTALERGLRTVAVLANGLDTVYPKANAELARLILAADGCLLSEVPPRRAVSRYNLVARDRLQSGLSAATFLMQSSLNGGSMHTALFTLQQRRTLIALKPPEPLDPSWYGNAFLLGMLAPNDINSDERSSRFERFPLPLAYGMAEPLIDRFVGRALESEFTPRRQRHTLSLELWETR